MSGARVAAPIYFGGKVKEPRWMPMKEWIWTEEALLHYICTVWVNQHKVPTEPAHLKRFNIEDLRPEYRAFIQGGGKIPERGQSLEEYWLGSQLILRSPITCLLNEAQPEQEVGRITRLRRLPASKIWAELKQVFAGACVRGLPSGVNPTPTLVYDGDEVAHIITALTVSEDELHYKDSWPRRSLLCKEQNSAGVAAQKSRIFKGRTRWQINRAEFERVVFAVYVHGLEEKPRPIVTLTREESEAARQQEQLRQTLRLMTPPRSKPIDGVKTISRLEFAALFNRVWEVKVAINEGDDLNKRGDGGNTALHLAAKKGHMEIVKLLVEHGGNRHVRNAEGKTPAEVALAHGKKAVAKYLMSLE